MNPSAIEVEPSRNMLRWAAVPAVATLASLGAVSCGGRDHEFQYPNPGTSSTTSANTLPYTPNAPGTVTVSTTRPPETTATTHPAETTAPATPNTTKPAGRTTTTNDMGVPFKLFHVTLPQGADTYLTPTGEGRNAEANGKPVERIMPNTEVVAGCYYFEQKNGGINRPGYWLLLGTPPWANRVVDARATGQPKPADMPSCENVIKKWG